MIAVLASASPRRKELIAKIEDLEVEIIPSGADENCKEASAERLVCVLANRKAKDVFAKTGKITIGADTVVVLGSKILGKPRTKAEAKAMLKSLCGKTHRVLTGVSVISKDGEQTECETTFVTFNACSDEMIDAYVASGSPMDKAGAYGIQDEGFAPFIKEVKGDLDNVIGLPVRLLEKMLKQVKD